MLREKMSKTKKIYLKMSKTKEKTKEIYFTEQLTEYVHTRLKERIPDDTKRRNICIKVLELTFTLKAAGLNFEDPDLPDVFETLTDVFRSSDKLVFPEKGHAH